MLVKPLVVIMGPTAVGKTAVSLHLARALQAEIISADSRQAYVGMDIGTAKATPAEQAVAPHHLLDIKKPDESLSLGEYLQLARAIIDELHGRDVLPLVVGGTGQYVRALIEGWQTPQVPPQPDIRKRLQAVAAEQGGEVLFARLQEADPQAAAAIDPRNVRRVIRALEVIEVSGRPFSEQQRKEPPPYSMLLIGLTRPRPLLYARADARIEAMFAEGFVDEVRDLLAAGYTPDLPAFSSLGYREVAAYVQGNIDLEEAKALLRRHTRQYIRRQYNWFRLSDERIRWFDLEEQGPDDVLAVVQAWLAGADAG